MTQSSMRTPARPTMPARPAMPARVALLLTLAALACTDSIPTAARGELVAPGVAVEVTIPFEDFVTSVAVYGGYGRASQLGGGFIAHEFGPGLDEDGIEGSGLEAATLVRYGRFPSSIQVVDTAGTNRLDTLITFHEGRILVRLDTVGSVVGGPVEITAHTIAEDWDPVSANWGFAVDTLGQRVAWSEPGAGAVERVGSAVWDPAQGDSVAIPVDSTLLATWADSAFAARDIRLSTTHAGARLRVTRAQLWISTVPSLRPDTVVSVAVSTNAATFIYHPEPRAPQDALRVGGAPAWRTILNLDVPHSLTGYPDLCARLQCPVDIIHDQVSYAGLRLTTLAGSPAFAPSDTLALDVRMVTAPNFLPKSPLGPSTLARSGGAVVGPELFRPPAGQIVEIPITVVVRDQLRGQDPDGLPISNSLALLSIFEPWSIEYATFGGRLSSSPPTLRMILNFSHER